MATTALERGLQYKLHAYVCGSACVKYSSYIGTVTFTRVFLMRPNDCRYAIVSRWNMEHHVDEFMVLDLFETLQGPRGGVHPPPEPMWKGFCLDAAIMATMMRYEED